MKTVAEIATQTGVSVQTVYRALKKIKQSEIGDITKKKGNITYVTVEGEPILIARLAENNPQINVNEDCFDEEQQHSVSELIEYLKEQNTILQESLYIERLHSRQQHDKLSSIACQMVEINKNQQVLLGREQDRNNLLLTESSKRKGIWQMFKKPKSE